MTECILVEVGMCWRSLLSCGMGWDLTSWFRTVNICAEGAFYPVAWAGIWRAGSKILKFLEDEVRGVQCIGDDVRNAVHQGPGGSLLVKGEIFLFGTLGSCFIDMRGVTLRISSLPFLIQIPNFLRNLPFTTF